MVSYDLGMVKYSRYAMGARSLQLAARLLQQRAEQAFHTLEKTLL
jgi:hypothetical protein